jgi:hypothetical protein
VGIRILKTNKDKKRKTNEDKKEEECDANEVERGKARSGGGE